MERSSHEKATLIFEQPEQAEQFRAEVEVEREGHLEGLDRTREVVAEKISEEMAQYGEPPSSSLSRPWQHTEAEHVEVQGLIDTAFAQDLPAALRRARRSVHYPRNLDLLHDVLTTHMYEEVRQQRLDHQPIAYWVIVSVCIGLLAFFVALYLVISSLA